jgi:hypothetical protein
MHKREVPPAGSVFWHFVESKRVSLGKGVKRERGKRKLPGFNKNRGDAKGDGKVRIFKGIVIGKYQP